MKTAHTTKNGSDVSASQHDGGGNFAAGFFLGVLGGAVGMFLLSADRGQALWQQLRQELAPWWDESDTSWQEKIASLGTVAPPNNEPPAKLNSISTASSAAKITASPAHRFPKFQVKPKN